MRPASVGLKFAAATRKETNVVKKPFASWIRLVETISVPICARIDPLRCIDPHLRNADSRQSRRTAILNVIGIVSEPSRPPLTAVGLQWRRKNKSPVLTGDL